MNKPATKITAASIYSSLSAFAERLARRMARDAQSLNDDDINKVMAEHVRQALLEIEDHHDSDTLIIADAAPGLETFRTVRMALDRFKRAQIELTDLLEIMDDSLNGHRQGDLSPLFCRVSRQDCNDVRAIVGTIDTLCNTAKENLAARESAFISRRGLTIVPNSEKGPESP